MGQSTTNLGKIHVFPSEALYNQFKDVIADNDLALLKDDGATVVETYRNGTEWYRVWSDGWVEQGGQLHWAATRNPGDKIVTLYKVMVDTNYNTLIEIIKGQGGTQGTSCYNHTTTAFTAFTYGHADNDKSVGLIWFACGQGA